MQLQVSERVVKGKKVSELRKLDMVPGVVYGKHLTAPFLVSFPKNAFIKIYKEVGNTRPIDLTGDIKDTMVLVRDYQTDPVSDKLIHVDFQAVKKDEKVTAEVEIVLEGKSLAEKNNVGRVQLVIDSLTVEAFPQDLPRQITIDVTKMEGIHDTILVKDLNLGNKITIKADEEKTLVTVVEIKDQWEEEPTGAAAVAETPAATEEKKA